mmetsp:Transcript_24395/g.41515  ORF Transcript_24395/g.41515 Transcript_24395/m.41515 type:complete len:110 (-) Transcript_24395:333-662(-)
MVCATFSSKRVDERSEIMADDDVAFVVEFVPSVAEVQIDQYVSAAHYCCIYLSKEEYTLHHMQQYFCHNDELWSHWFECCRFYVLDDDDDDENETEDEERSYQPYQGTF